MLIEEIVQKVLIFSVHHLLNLMMNGSEGIGHDRGHGIVIALYDHLYRTDFPERANVVPAPAPANIEDWGRIVAHFLYVRLGLVTDESQDFEIVNAYERILPQMYADLAKEGEIAEIRLVTS